MGQVIMCGIDVHDNSLVCRLGVDREEATTHRHANSSAGRGRLFARLKGLARRHGSGRIVVAYEASSQGFALYDDCREAGIECFVLAPTKMRKSREERKKKNDEKDAQLILETLRGHVLAGNDLPSIWIPDDATRADRETVRARLDVGRKISGVKTQVQMLLKRHRIEKPTDLGQSWTVPHRAWLWDLAGGEHGWPALSTLLRQLKFLEHEAAVLDREVEALSKTGRYASGVAALVGELKGVGTLTAMVFLTELGDLSRFQNRRQVGAYLGLVPSSHDSGEQDRKGHITREGSARVRQMLCQAAWSRVQHDPGAAEWYNQLVARNPKHKKIAAVAVMRKLGILMWRIGRRAQLQAGVFGAGPDQPATAAGG